MCIKQIDDRFGWQSTPDETTYRELRLQLGVKRMSSVQRVRERFPPTNNKIIKVLGGVLTRAGNVRYPC